MKYRKPQEQTYWLCSRNKQLIKKAKQMIKSIKETDLLKDWLKYSDIVVLTENAYNRNWLNENNWNIVEFTTTINLKKIIFK